MPREIIHTGEAPSSPWYAQGVIGVLLTNPEDFAGMNAVYAEAARKATNLAERDHLTRQAARLNTRLRS